MSATTDTAVVDQAAGRGKPTPALAPPWGRFRYKEAVRQRLASWAAAATGLLLLAAAVVFALARSR